MLRAQTKQGVGGVNACTDERNALRYQLKEGELVALVPCPSAQTSRLMKTCKGAERAEAASEEESKAEHGEGRHSYIKACKLYVPVQRRGNLSATS